MTETMARPQPFGRARVRVVERELIEEYLALTDHLAGRLSQANAALAVRLAELPDRVRGFEEVKMRNVEAYHQAMTELRAQFDETSA
jgi:indolepyruvate ferredoxin oxidoreductase